MDIIDRLRLTSPKIKMFVVVHFCPEHLMMAKIVLFLDKEGWNIFFFKSVAKLFINAV